MSIFVAGGSGFIGTNLVKRLEKLDRVTNLDIRNGHDCNVNNYSRVHFFVNQADIVFHLANIPAHRLSMGDPRDLMMNNYATTLNIAESCRNSNCKKIVYLSSFAVYGNNRPPWTEETLPDATTPYGLAKIISESLLIQYHEWYGIDVIIIRPSNVFGPYEDLHKPMQVIPQWIDDARNGRPLTVYGVRTTRDFTYVDDIVDGIIKASKKKGFETYNLCSGKPTLLVNVALRLSKNVHVENLPSHETEQWWGSYEKAKKDLDYSPTKNIMEWIDEQRERITGNKVVSEPRVRRKKDIKLH